ncbi:hypothetical protein [[Clostridium] polysaccharolyticum]|jgi:hypothetical protein|uniref:Uncharacterized protein n=1 Tax=[Clostridium] polysaccharolyticum TaxID=29364 RepID=A0A1I0D1K5_9FIRM|nr:hypothetical protein [[Clostridium] polysaccharolyticum]SET25957.1 hypothetical protein SAMN04487772_11266 [[Clostridium] polysaccharolyticum]
MDKRTKKEFESMLHDFETVSEIEAKKEVNGANIPAVVAYAVTTTPVVLEIIKKLFG